MRFTDPILRYAHFIEACICHCLLLHIYMHMNWLLKNSTRHTDLGVVNGRSKTMGLAKFLSNFTGLAVSFFQRSVLTLIFLAG